MGFFNRRRKAEAQRQAAEEERLRIALEQGKLRAESQPRPVIRPTPTKPNSGTSIPQHLIDRSNAARQRNSERDTTEEFERDLRRIYSPLLDHDQALQALIKMFQRDWNLDNLPLKGIRPVINLPDLPVDGIPGPRTQHAITAYRRLTSPDTLGETAATILNRFQHDIDLMPAEEPLRPKEELVDDLQDLLSELDNPT